MSVIWPALFYSTISYAFAVLYAFILSVIIDPKRFVA